MKRAILGLFLALAPGAQAAPELARRWVYVSNNLYVDANLPKIEAVVDRAAKAGYTGVLFTDFKTFTWWTLEAADRWRANAQRLRRMTADRGLELVVAVFPFGRAEAMLYHDPNLASGMPVTDAPMTARGGVLVPDATAQLKNGSFEETRGDTAARWGFQDEPGRGSFIDRSVVKHGQASLRFENVGRANPHGNGRVSQPLAVRPWQQYRLRAWMKTDRLNADQIQLLVIGGGRVLQHQFLVAGGGKRPEHAGSARDLTTDWVEQSVAFNSLGHSNVTFYAGVWGAKDGRIWWDDVRIDDAPLLNVLRRPSLPLTVRGADGTVFEEGRDFAAVADPGMGRTPWPGSFDTRHDPPVVRIPPDSRIREGDALRLSCFHPALVYEGQVNCSMVEPKVYELCAQQVRHAREALAPDGWLMSHDEIRAGGWEPEETRAFKTSGDLLADNARRCREVLAREGGGKPVYVWSDMFDPAHNARAGYYLVNNTLSNSWAGLDRGTTVVKWGGGSLARPGLEFFAGRGHRQMIAAFYDGDVAADHRMWTDAARGIEGVEGVIYTTWANDYSQLERFAQTWWGGGTQR